MGSSAQRHSVQFSSAKFTPVQFVNICNEEIDFAAKEKKKRKFIQDARAAPKHLLQSKNYELGYVVLARNNAILRWMETQKTIHNV